MLTLTSQSYATRDEWKDHVGFVSDSATVIKHVLEKDRERLLYYPRQLLERVTPPGKILPQVDNDHESDVENDLEEEVDSEV